MKKTLKKDYSAKEKVYLLKKHLVHGIPVTKICQEYEIPMHEYFEWERRLFDEGRKVFEIDRSVSMAQ